MKTRTRCLTLTTFLIATVQCVSAQGEAAVPFLLLPPSPEANGMAGTATAAGRNDPTAALINPAQLGAGALATGVRGSFYTRGTAWLPGFFPADARYSAWAATASLALNDLVDLPFRAGVALGFQSIDFDLGTFAVTGVAGPTVIGTYSSYENSRSFGVGAGFEYVVKFAAGLTFHSVESHLSPIGTEQEMAPGEADVTARSYGIMACLPVFDIARDLSGESIEPLPGVAPLLDLTGGMAWNNFGDRVVYVDPAQADPLPRTGRIGLGLEAGLHSAEAGGWRVLSFAWSREADDLLVTRLPDGTWNYDSGLGNLSFTENLLRGAAVDGVNVRTGWQIQVFELITIRNGRVNSFSSYDTRGLGFRLSGLLKGTEVLLGDQAPDWLVFLRTHFDLEYNTSHYTAPKSPYDDMSYDGLVLQVSGHPW
jgi:hypothetical protein